jgi:hypothetical protein
MKKADLPPRKRPICDFCFRTALVSDNDTRYCHIHMPDASEEE